MSRHVITAVAVVALFLQFGTAGAQGENRGKFGVGFQSSFPAWGVSGMMDISNNMALQGILGAFGDLKLYGGRGIYRFRQEQRWNTYGYGLIGAWSYKGIEIDSNFTWKETTETVVGFGAGVGVEYDWRAWVPGLPPIWSNLEIGFGRTKFEEVDYDFSTFMLGAGFHYRF